MTALILKRVAQAIPVMLIVAILTFLLMKLLPGDPAILIAGDGASPETVERIRAELGLDQPTIVQLGQWLWNLFHFDLGRSFLLSQPVSQAIAERLPVTISLALLAFAITIPVGIVMGVVAAYWRDSWFDTGVMSLALLGVSVPSFWLAILAVILFSVTLGWFPSAGYVPFLDSPLGWLQSLVLPASILALFQIGYLARMTRSEMLEVMDQDYIRTARSKGVSEYSVLSTHAFRNALVSVLTVSGYIFSLLIGGSVVIEQIFALPGLGRLLVQAILARDLPVVQGTMLFLGFLFVAINVLVDILYTIADPRVRYD
ncbi:ABC transporter permease [Brucella cytisi]|jgi:peptide/nickel transport system permease protein|uniref:Peptide ABC transporter n=1 Tax=Brucella cytisi TaxID=407152 RepID=A0A1J6HZH1_9HYPH|nr:ABC transporter permease [Brucella cytisi]OIS92034.1 peptide ABC transporter [Brucella cytisi]